MPLVRIKVARFGEGWKIGDVVGMDDEAARVPLENGEVELVTDPVAVQPTPILDDQDNLKPLQFICPICQKVCNSKAGLSAHMRSHK